jgi:hypothetical protein
MPQELNLEYPIFFTFSQYRIVVRGTAKLLASLVRDHLGWITPVQAFKCLRDFAGAFVRELAAAPSMFYEPPDEYLDLVYLTPNEIISLQESDSE